MHFVINLDTEPHLNNIRCLPGKERLKFYCQSQLRTKVYIGCYFGLKVRGLKQYRNVPIEPMMQWPSLQCLLGAAAPTPDPPQVFGRLITCPI